MSCCIDEPADVYSELWPVARKQYKCCECYSVIPKGEIYQRVRMLYDGMWSTYKTCEKCADLRASLSEIDCPYFEGLRECYQQNVRPNIKPGTHAAKLVPDYYLVEEA